MQSRMAFALARSSHRSLRPLSRNLAQKYDNGAMGLIELRNAVGSDGGRRSGNTKFFTTTTTTAEGTTTTKQQEVEEKQYGFQAETSKLLDIVSKSLYSEREVFLRELISNASDALEKFRYTASKGVQMRSPGRELRININVDPALNTITIADNGIGMNEKEVIENLGTIGKSGSQQFVKENAKDTSSSIIGQFGVGFYSAFMVGENVEVKTIPSKLEEEQAQEQLLWKSKGKDAFSLSKQPIPSDQEGTSITIHLRKDASEFSEEKNVKRVIQKYSNFIPFPVYLNGNRVNTMEALWCESPDKVTPEKHEEFFKFINKASFEAPLMTLHFRADVPIDIKALLYVPKNHTEKPGMGRMRPNISLYTRKVILESNSTSILPDWARFVSGVVDSEDLPLSISRETAQDKRIVEKVSRAITKRFLKFLKDKTADAKLYNEFWNVYGHFIKEGVCSDYANQPELAKLMRFDTSILKSEEKFASLDEIISRMDPSQKKLYFLSAPSRELALSSPYLEIFQKKKIEVIFLYHTLDDFVMANLKTYEGKEFVACESSDIDVNQEDEEAKKTDGGGDKASETGKKSEYLDALKWMESILSKDVASVTETNRLTNVPAVIVDHESASLRRMMKMVDQHESKGFSEFLKQKKHKLEVNMKHPIMEKVIKLYQGEDKAIAELLMKQVLDSAVIQAGLNDDPRDVVPRMNALIEQLLKKI